MQPYVPQFAPLLNTLGSHLALLRPHMRRLLPHMAVIAPSAYRFSKQLQVSANADILLFYFGWVLRIPWLGSFVLRLPFLPRLANFLCQVLPRRPVRGRTCDYECDWAGCDLDGFTTEQAALAAADNCAAGWVSNFDEKRQRLRATAALLRRMKQARAVTS